MSQNRIPEYLKNNLMFSRRVQISANECFDIVLTRGPRIHLTKDNEVLAVCDLTSTILKESECKQSDFICSSQEPSKLFDFDICYSYAGNVKNVFFLLKMRDKLVVMLKSHNHITVSNQFENVRLFKVEEYQSNVHIKIELMNGLSHSECLTTTTYNPIIGEERFATGVATSIANRISSAKAELSTTKLDVQKYFHILAKELRFGPFTLHNSVEERVMLAKFGDIWIKRHNDMLVFGVPVYNCCYLSKRIVENIRLTLLSDQLNHFDFTYKLYRFELDETTTPNYEEIFTKEDSFLFPSFDQEWQPSENNSLTPDTAAIIVVTTSIPDFVDFAVLEFDCFVEYEIDDDSRISNLQNFMGKISINSDIFYDAKFLVTFERNSVYKDLLAVTSTSEFVFIKLAFMDLAVKESFYDFLQNQLAFTKRTELSEEQDYDMDKLDIQSTTSNVQHTDIYFLSIDSSYWKTTLLRTHSTHHLGLVDELKIYNSCKGKISSLIQTLKSRFDKLAIEFVDPRCDAIKLSVLKHAVQKEVQYVRNKVQQKSDIVDESYVNENEKLKREFETDVACT